MQQRKNEKIVVRKSEKYIKHAGKYHYADCKFPTEDSAACHCNDKLPDVSYGDLEETIDRQFIKGGLKDWELNVIVQCLKYSKHRISTCSHAGIKYAFKESELDRVIKKLTN